MFAENKLNKFIQNTTAFSNSAEKEANKINKLNTIIAHNTTFQTMSINNSALGF